MSIEHKGEETVDLSHEMARRRSHLNPDELIAPTCMYWAMIAGFVLLGGMMLFWAIGNLDKITQ
ncbi:MAG: hypothetical protein WCD37_08975 [Chloroflexia bacterium]